MYAHVNAHLFNSECQGKVEGFNKILKAIMSNLIKATATSPQRWTSVVTAAVNLLNSKDKAAYGANSAPDLIAEGVTNPGNLVVNPEDLNVLEIEELKDHAAFVQHARDEVVFHYSLIDFELISLTFVSLVCKEACSEGQQEETSSW
jgi:hypothetical protein